MCTFKKYDAILFTQRTNGKAMELQQLNAKAVMPCRVQK